ncbi:NTP transferase domain-containing protein [Joostella sp. CR20]
MGIDKGLLAYHELPQREYVFKMLLEICDSAYISIRENQQKEFTTTSSLIVDEDTYKGPINGILSAHHYNKNVAWLVVACDLPLLNVSTLAYLKSKRNKEKVATVFLSEEKNIEPLCAIWEPHGLEKVKTFIAENNTYSPSKFLQNEDVEKVLLPNCEDLWNVNEQSEVVVARQKIKERE